MKKGYILLIVLMAVIFVGVLTNPTKEDYLNYNKEQGIQKSENIVEKGVYTFLSKSFVDTNTITKNYAVFTIYETALGDGKVKKVIGAFNNFFSLDKVIEEVKES